MKRTIRAGIASVMALALFAGAQAQSPGRVTSTMATYDPGAWTYWGGDAGQTRYVPLNEINLSTVSRLKIAWRWSADTSGGGASNNFKGTPLLADGVLYTPWLNHGMAAIDAGTGKTIWTFEPQPVDIGGGAPTLAPRSLSYWTDGTEKRLFHNSLDGRLIAVDARTGRAAAGFGQNGWVDLRDNLAEGRPRVNVRSVSPGIVVGDVIVVQVIPGNAGGREGVPGNIRGYDVRTGALKWTFDVVPRRGQFGYDTWANNSADYAGNTGVWSMMSADPELGLVYLPTDTPHNDFSGADRPGDGLFAESLVALDARTGERRWHFQIVHHGVWDYDMPSAPILHDVVQNGRRIKAVTQLTKQTLVFTFNRETGEPLFPIEERPVPQEGAPPGELLSPTQPFPTRIAPLGPIGYSENLLSNFTPQIRAEAVEIMKSYTKGPLYTPITEVSETNRGTLVYPGFGGGANWNGASFDPETGIMYVPIRHRWSSVGLTRADPARTSSTYTQSGNHTVQGPRGLPIMAPPYSELVAVDMNAGDHLWRTAIGGAPDSVRNHPDLQGLGLDFDTMGQFDIRPGPLLTRELLFMGESGTISASRGGEMLRAYDKRTGRAVHQVELPTLSTGAPMSYVHNGRQYIVIAVSAPGRPAELIALTLDGVSENGPPPAGGVPVSAAPASTAVAAAAITATPEELALGAAQFADACAACHGDRGEGGEGGPRVAGRTDFDNIVRAIRQGQGEMPGFANALTPAQIEAISKHVVRTLGPQQGGRGGRGAGGPPPED